MSPQGQPAPQPDDEQATQKESRDIARPKPKSKTMSTTLTLAKPAWHRMAAEKAQQAISQNTPFTWGVLTTLITGAIGFTVWMLTSFGDVKTDNRLQDNRIELQNARLDRMESELKLFRTEYLTREYFDLQLNSLKEKIEFQGKSKK